MHFIVVFMIMHDPPLKHGVQCPRTPGSPVRDPLLPTAGSLCSCRGSIHHKKTPELSVINWLLAGLYANSL